MLHTAMYIFSKIGFILIILGESVEHWGFLGQCNYSVCYHNVGYMSDIGQTYGRYNITNEPWCKLWICGDNEVSVEVRCHPCSTLVQGDGRGVAVHALSWTVTCMETIRDITFEFIGFRFFLTGWTLWLLLLWMHIGLVSTLWNFVEIQTYHTLTLIRHLCNTNLMKSPWDQHDLHIRHVITSKLPSFMVTSYARSWENVVWLLFDFVW